MTTEFERIVQQRQGATRRGRPSVLTQEQREERRKVQNAKNRLRNEARRRAYIVLQYRYNEEFQALLDQELQNLSNNDARYAGIPISATSSPSENLVKSTEFDWD
jgi:hypothetical protein